MGLETIWVVGEYLCWIHLLKLPYLDTLRSRLVCCLMDRAINLSEGQDHIPYMEKHVLLKVKAGHLSTVSPFLLFFHFDLEIGEVTPNLCWMLWQMYFYKINPKSKWENVWNPAEKHCLLWAQRLLLCMLLTGDELVYTLCCDVL